MADEVNVRPESKVRQSFGDSGRSDKVKYEDSTTISQSFLYNGRFSVLTVLCSLPFLYFGGERLFGVGTLCLLAVYILQITFKHTKSSVVGYLISMIVMQFCIIYSIGPLLWHSFFNIFLLVLYNVFIVLTGGLGLIQFETFRKDEIVFCAHVEYFLFLLYPPTCLVLLVWLFSLTFGIYLAPYLFIVFGFPICHTFLDPKIKCSFIKNDYVLGQHEKILTLFNFICGPPFAYFLVNFFYLLHYSSWIAMSFCISVPIFLVTFLDTSDLRDLADINNAQWQLFQVASGCFSLIVGNILIYLHGLVDGLSTVYIGITLICSTALFVTVKYRYSQRVKFVASCLLFFSYLGWFCLLPWNLIFTMGTMIKMSFFTVELLISLLGLLSVLVIALSINVSYRQFLNQILVIHTSVFVIVEEVLIEAGSYSMYIMVATSVLLLYMVQRLHYVDYLTKTSSLLCISLHGAKLVVLATTTCESSLSFLSSLLGGLLLSYTLTNLMLFEHKQRIDRQKAVFYSGCFLFSLIILSPNFLRMLWIMMTHNEPSIADTLGLILVVTGVFVAKVTFLHMDDHLSRKQSLALLVLGVLIIMVQPYFNILEIITHVPKVIFREVLYGTWQVALAEYMILPWCLLLSLSIILVLILQLLPLKELSSLSFNIISCFIGAPLGLYLAHLVLPYPEVSSSFLSIPYMLSASFATKSLLLVARNRSTVASPTTYMMFLVVSVVSVAIEINEKITIAQVEIPPSVLFQGILHLIKIIQLRQECGLQTSLDKKKSPFPSIACNVSVAFVFLFGLWFAPNDYYDILVVPLCGCLMLLRTKDLMSKKKEEFRFNMIMFVIVLGLILYYRALQQLPLIKISFWIAVGLILELSFLLITFSVLVIIILVFWKEKMSAMEERGLAFLGPVFTLLLFYCRTSAGQVLGIVGPILVYYTFYYAFR